MAAIVFDLDGTLIDSAPDMHRAASAALAAEGKPPLSLQTIRTFIGNGVPVLIRRVMVASGLQGDDAHARLLACFMSDYSRAPALLTRCYSGVERALEILEDRGHVLAVCTNKPERVSRAILSDRGIAGHFRTVIGGDTLDCSKPDPRPLNAAFAALQSDVCLYVGDSEVDSETALRARTPFFMFTGGYCKSQPEDLPHERLFSDFSSLPDLVENYLATAL